LSMSITLTENFQHNGPLMLIPGSHLQYAVCEGATPENNFLTSLKAQRYGIPSNTCLQSMVEKGGIESVVGKPGSVTIFDCNLMHGSNSNITPHARSNAFFVYNALSNRVLRPFSDLDPRPEHICSRKTISPIISTAKVLK
jgi:ectoine hydroxylase